MLIGLVRNLGVNLVIQSNTILKGVCLVFTTKIFIQYYGCWLEILYRLLLLLLIIMIILLLLLLLVVVVVVLSSSLFQSHYLILE